MKQPRTIPCPRCDRKFASPDALLSHARTTHDNLAWKPRVPLERSVQSVAAIRAIAEEKLRCPRCGETPHFSHGTYGLKAECCGLWSWNGKPLVSREVHRARIAAHDAFDPLWKSGQMSRPTAYHRLRLAMSMTPEECHISLMNERQARRVVEVIAAGCMLQDEVAAA